MKYLLFLCASILPLFAASPQSTAAEDLLQVYNQALENDPVLAQARAQYNASHTFVAEGRSQLLPTISLSGNTARNTQAPTVSHTYSEGFNTHSYSLNINQNLLNFEAWYSFQSARAADREATSVLARSEQELILRTVTAYFDVLRSQSNLALFQAEEEAARQVMDQSQQRYDLGFTEISDVYDSQAGYSQARINRLEEENLLRQAIEVLEVITGGQHNQLETLQANFPVVSAEPSALEAWLNLAGENNLDIQAAEHSLDSSQLQTKAAKSAHLPTLSLNASYNDTAERANSFAFISEASNSTAIRLTLNIPLYSGGANRSRLKRAYYERDLSRETLTLVEREVFAQTRNSFRSIETALRTVAAREETIAIAENALEATEVGIEVGTRNVVDLVQAQRTLFQARRDYTSARLDYVLNTLYLKQAAGILSPQDILDLNEWLSEPE